MDESWTYFKIFIPDTQKFILTQICPKTHRDRIRGSITESKYIQTERIDTRGSQLILNASYLCPNIYSKELSFFKVFFLHLYQYKKVSSPSFLFPQSMVGFVFMDRTLRERNKCTTHSPHWSLT